MTNVNVIPGLTRNLKLTIITIIMDKIIEKKTGWRVAFTKKALPWWLGALLAAFIIYLIARPNNKTLRVDKELKEQADALFEDMGLSLNTACEKNLELLSEVPAEYAKA